MKNVFLILLFLTLTVSYSQNFSKKWNSTYQRYDYSDSNGYLMGYENLTEKSYDEVIENSFNIHFTSINLNFKEHTDRSPKTLTKKSIVDFRFPSYWFIAFSTNYSFVNQTKTTLTIKMSNDDITFDIQKLKRARITYEIND